MSNHYIIFFKVWNVVESNIKVCAGMYLASGHGLRQRCTNHLPLDTCGKRTFKFGIWFCSQIILNLIVADKTRNFQFSLQMFINKSKDQLEVYIFGAQNKQKLTIRSSLLKHPFTSTHLVEYLNRSHQVTCCYLYCVINQYWCILNIKFKVLIKSGVENWADPKERNFSW